MTNANLKPLVLHAHGTGPNPYKVAIALEILQLPYQVKLWDFGDAKGGVKSPEFLNINENGRVPALEDPNTSVTSWESGACVNYLLRVYDKQNQLGPRGKSEQDHVDFDKWIFFLATTLGPMVGQVNWFRHYHSQKNDDALERYVAQAKRSFGVLDAQLGKSGGGSVLPGGFSAVDVHFYPWILQHDFAGLSLDDYPNIKSWFEKIKQMKEVKAAYKSIPEGEHA
ncbi:hypothetical protein MBLNU457_3540t2 [Dothideomycetes sp. NU457]